MTRPAKVAAASILVLVVALAVLLAFAMTGGTDSHGERHERPVAGDAVSPEARADRIALRKRSQCIDRTKEVLFTLVDAAISGTTTDIMYKYGVDSEATRLAAELEYLVLDTHIRRGQEAAVLRGLSLVSRACLAAHPASFTDFGTEPEQSPVRSESLPGAAAEPDEPSAVAGLNEVEAQEYDAVAEACNPDLGSLTKAGDDGMGLTAWTYTSAGEEFTAYASGEYHSGVAVESCGSPVHGLDIPEIHKAVREEAEAGWGISVAAVTCTPPDEQPLDEPPSGLMSCTTWNDQGGQSYVGVQFTDLPPFYDVVLGE